MENVCPECDDLNGQEFDIADDIPVPVSETIQDVTVVGVLNGLIN
jgi:hypothetical protein